MSALAQTRVATIVQQTVTTSTEIISHKSRIAKQFSRAAGRYDSAAKVQLDIAQEALVRLQAGGQTLLDIGCGTGRNSPYLAQKSKRVIGMDLAFGMLAYAQQNNTQGGRSHTWFQGDAEQLPIQSHSIDRVYSSMVLQWCHQQQQVMAEINRVMSSGAEAVLAIMCDGSFSELNQSWKKLDNMQHVNNFASAQLWQKAALQQGLKVTLSVKPHVTWHSNLRQLFASIKAIGANVVLPNTEFANHKQQTEIQQKRKQLGFNRHTLKNLEAVYQQQFAENGQLPLTYQVCYLHCIKR